jgi:23S rRNA (cytidine1920-2'-O)/16S rRNA (cytidine1409-2'-O)-methyltransferase
VKTCKQRLDALLVNRGLAQSRPRALALILAGAVWVDDQRVTKAGARVSTDACLRVTAKDLPYVSRGGLKLEAAIKEFGIVVRGLRCLDVGASTGGFTDCLLQYGAIHVTAVDVGYGQLDWGLRCDPRVTVLERTNIRHLDPQAIPCAVDLACIDVSFISLKLVVPAVLPCVKPSGRIVCLIKPQFEVGKGLVGKGGVVRDPDVRRRVTDDLVHAFQDLGLSKQGLIPCPVLGPKGNQEYLVLLTLNLGTVNMFT